MSVLLRSTQGGIQFPMLLPYIFAHVPQHGLVTE